MQSVWAVTFNIKRYGFTKKKTNFAALKWNRSHMNNALIIETTDYNSLVREVYDIVDYEDAKTVSIGTTAKKDTFVVFLPDKLPASLVILYFDSFGIRFMTKTFTPYGWLRLDNSVKQLHSNDMVMFTMTDVMIDGEKDSVFAIITPDGNCYMDDEDNLVDDEKYSFTLCLKPQTNAGIKYKQFSMPRVVSKEKLEITEDKRYFKINTPIKKFLVSPFDSILYTLLDLFSFVKLDVLRVILAMLSIAGLLFITVAGWIMFEDTLLPVYFNGKYVFATTAVIGFLVALYARKDNRSILDFLEKMFNYTFFYAAYFYFFAWIVLAPNKYIPIGEQKTMDATIVESRRKYTRSGHYYQIEFTFNHYPYTLSRSIGDDGSFHKGQKCKILYYTGLYGLDVIDDITH